MDALFQYRKLLPIDAFRNVMGVTAEGE